MIVRRAGLADAAGMTGVQNTVIRIGGTTAYEVERTVDQVAADYLTGADALCAHVAIEAGRVIGFQVLGANPDLPQGWCDIGTFVQPGLQRGGVGAALFAATQGWARAQGIVTLNATIRADNTVGLGYYAKRGFVNYATEPDLTLKDGRVVGRISTRFDLI